MKSKIVGRHGNLTIEVEGQDPIKIVKQYKALQWELGLLVYGGHGVLPVSQKPLSDKED